MAYTLNNEARDTWGAAALQGLADALQGKPSALGQQESDSSYVSTAPEEVKPVETWAESKELINQLQQRLVQRGQNPGTIDGLWGPKTSAAFEQARIAAEIMPGTTRVNVLQNALGFSYNTAARIRDAINYQLTHKQTKPSGDGSGTQITPVPDTTDLLPTTTLAKTPLTHKWWFWVLVVAALAGGGYGVYRYVKWRRENEEGGMDEGEFSEMYDEDDDDF